MGGTDLEEIEELQTLVAFQAFLAYRAFLAYQGVPCLTILVLQEGSLVAGVQGAMVGGHPAGDGQGGAVALVVNLDQQLVEAAALLVTASAVQGQQLNL